MKHAGSLKRGDWLIRASGAYLVDGVQIAKGLAYIGTKRGVLVLPATTPVLVAA